VLWSWISPM